ncbi:MAG TPA: alpha/beta hydrolase [Spongiibacteraceae bacterium]
MSYNFDSELAGIIPLLPEIQFTDPATARTSRKAMIEAMNRSVDVSGLRIEDKLIAGPEGAPQVPVRIYAPAQRNGNLPALLYMHGGGYIVGSIDTEHTLTVMLTRELGVAVVSVDYRLAPENPYPAAVDDCYAALLWLHAHAGEQGVDTARIAVIGQSAGAGLAAAIALMARDRNGPALCFQFLGIPDIDDRLDTPSMRTFTDTPVWHRAHAELSWNFYLGDSYKAGAADVPVYAAPARATDLRGLPPAYISAMEFDPLRDEGILYAMKLMEAGVPVELHTYPGTFHGSMMVTQAAVTQRQIREMLDVLRRALKL